MKLRNSIQLLCLSSSLLFTACNTTEPEAIYVEKTSPLENTFWKLESYGYDSSEKKDVLISSTYTLKFKNASFGVYIQTDCETTQTKYEDETLLLYFTKKITNQKKCPLYASSIYQNQHSFILETLNTTASYILETNTLILKNDNNQALYYTKIISETNPSEEIQELKAFQSDGCSVFPDGTLFEQELWLKCCQAHDYAYWKGGTFEEKESADKKLEECVSEVGEPQVAALMLLGVTVGGSPLFPTDYRWGYGWPYPKNYGELTETELQQIKELSN